MKIASDFRKTAREGLKGKWVMAVIAGFVATLLGGAAGTNVDINFNVSSSGGGKTLIDVPESLGTMLGNIPPMVWGIVGGVAFVALVIGVAYFILSSIVTVGYAKFNLNVVDGLNLSVDTLFSYISEWKRMIAANFLQTVYIFLWTCLFIVPGIVASYRYSMTKYILAEDATISAGEAIARSKEMMKGNKWRLFCLGFSFIGWSLLSALTFGIGNLWLTPYRRAAEAAFYRHITGTEAMKAQGIV